MPSPAIEPRIASDRHDVVLALALGALSSARRYEDAVSQPAASGEPLAADDPVVLAALGVVAVTRVLRRWLAEAADVAVADDPPQESSMSPRELLR